MSYESPSRLKLKAGTAVHVQGIQVYLVDETTIDTSHRQAVIDTDCSTFAAYPKSVVNAAGATKVVQSAAEEAEWCAKPSAEPPTELPAEPSNPLDDVELTGAALNTGHVPEPDAFDVADEPKARRGHGSHGGAKKK